jgi:hypothetical protein
MRQAVVILVTLLTFPAGVAAEANHYETGVQQKFVSGGSIHLHLEAGGYTISPADSDNIIVTYSAKSAGQLRRVKVEIKLASSRADIYVTRTPHNNFRATIEVPRHSNLWARLTAGEITVENVEGDKDLELLAGQLDIEIPHPNEYGHRDASVTAGSLDAPAFNVSKGGLFRSFHDQGPGKYRLHAHVMTGEVDLHGTE